MTDLMDSWIVKGEKWDLPYDFRVRLTHDGDVHPMDDYDCYSTEDFLAWKRDEWCFVTIDLVPEDEFGATYEAARDSLGAVEWGMMPEVTIDRARLEESHIRDMATEVSAAADEIRKKIADRVANGEPAKCPYTHAHTKHWCGYEGCRES